MNANHRMLELMPGGRTGLGAFMTTHWTQVLAAAVPDAVSATEAFARLYSDYWYPLYAYTRRRGFSPSDTEDITQDFFVHLINHRSLEGLEREGGKFRSFLLRSLDNFLANVRDRACAQKRGSGMKALPLELNDGEVRYAHSLVTKDTPESLFEKQWVFTLLVKVMESLKAECEASGKAGLFEDLQPHLQGDRQGLPYAELAAKHRLSEGAMKVAAHRLRRRYGELLRAEIARTVSSPQEVDDELRYLIGVSGK